jgi:small subunit ribosomal protein S16
MLTIRMQRTGRKGHAMFRVVVQDSRQAPTSGKVVAALGSYDPHAKTVTLNKEKASFYLENGAQPSDRAARLLKSEGVKLPSWVKDPVAKERSVRNPEKRRSTAPAQPEEEAPAPAEAEAAEPAETAAEPAEATEVEAEPVAEDAPAGEASAEKLAEETETEEKA